MKRVGNKSGQLVRSASRRGKASSRFQFDITVDRVFGTKPGANYFVKWSRGVKVATTKTLASTKDAAGKAGLVFNEKISLMVTLYREEGKRFDAKDAKLSLVAINAGRKQERTAAKMHFDLSPFAGVPSASATKVFKLSDKVSIRATVDSRLIKVDASRPGSGGASSAMSGMTGVSGPSSDDDEGDDDFGDLALEDVPEPEVFSTSSAKSKKAPPVGKAPGNVPQSKVALVAETPTRALASSSASDKNKPPSPLLPAGESPRRGGVSPLVRTKRERSSSNTAADEGHASQLADFEAKTAKVTQQNERLTADLHNARQESQMMREAHARQVDELKRTIERQAREAAAAAVSARTVAEKSVNDVREKKADHEQRLQTLGVELADVKKHKDMLEAKCKSLSSVENKNRELAREVDRLTVAAAAGRGDVSHGHSEVESRLAELRKEKEALDTRLKRHESHAAQVKSTYQQLSQMYDDLRDQNSALQSELDATKEKFERRGIDEANGQEDLLAELDEARQEVRDIEASKESLQSDHDRLLSQVTSLQERLANTSDLLEESQREVEDLCSERDELKGQRDMAMQRALSRGKSGSGSENSSSRSLGKAEEEMRVSKDKYEREHVRLTRRVVELESEVTDLREDIEYEKAEKLKAREDRDKIRENARELERKTSNAALQSDVLHSLRRQLSTHQMREQDHEAMIADLQADVDRLQGELEASTARPNHSNSNTDDVGEVLQDLVATKLALAQAEDDKLNLQFAMKTLKKNEKAIQQRLAAHASRLEVKLGHANEELERLRTRSSPDHANLGNEFNELGSDVDY